VVILVTQGVVLYTQQYNKKQVSLSCPKIPDIPKPQRVDLSGIKKIALKLDLVIKNNKKLDQIIREQRKVDRIIQRMDTWGIER
jgi:hypothetical protein